MRPDDAVLAKGPTTVRRLVEDEPLRARPDQIDFAVDADRGHDAFECAITIDSVPGRVRHPEGRGERLAAVFRQGEVDMACFLKIRTTVFREAGPRDVDAVVGSCDEPRLVLEWRDRVFVIHDGDGF